MEKQIKMVTKKILDSFGRLDCSNPCFFLIPKEEEGYSYLELKERPYGEKVLAVGQMGLEGETTLIAKVAGTVQSLGGKDGEILPEGSLLLSIYDPDQAFLLAQKESGYLVDTNTV